jgi:hypothetical protein
MQNVGKIIKCGVFGFGIASAILGLGYIGFGFPSVQTLREMDEYQQKRIEAKKRKLHE